MTQSEFIAEIAAKTNLASSTIKQVLEVQGDIVLSEIKRTEITLPKLGKIGTKFRAARNGRNPTTGEAIRIAAKQVPIFKPSKALKEAADNQIPF